MGRRKLNEAPSVGDKKKLMKLFNKKKSIIFKKTYELSTLCDIHACVIIYGRDGDEPPCVWPEEPQGFNSVLARYMNTSSEERNKGALGLPLMPKKLQHDQVLDAGNAKQFEKLRNNGFLWDDRINSFSSEQLMGLVNQLNSKVNIVNSRIDVIKKVIQSSAKLESEQLYNAAAEEEKIMYNVQTMQSLHQYQCQQDYLRYLEGKRQQAEMIEMMNQCGFYYNMNNNNVNVGDYNGFMGSNMVNGVPMCDPTPLACYDPRTQLQAQPHQSYTSLLREA